MNDLRQELVQRSGLYMPANVPKFIESAWRREADVVLLDLEDSVPPRKKEEARRCVKDAVPVAGRGGSEVFVRVNNRPGFVEEDLDASIWPGVTGVHFPKPESPEQMHALCAALDRLEAERGMPAGTVRVTSSVESANAFFRAREIIEACPRMVGFGVSSEDLPLDLGIEPSNDGEELLYARQHIVLLCRATGVQPRGVAGSIANYSDLDAFRAAARSAARRGCMGANGIHPAQIPLLNEAFSPAPEKVAHARRVIEAYEEAEARGTASVGVDGKMVDIPVVERARRLLLRAEAVARRDAEKKAARERAESGG